MAILDTNAHFLQTRPIIHSALEQYSKQGNSLKMTTGSGDFDSLLDGIEEGFLYLFYGDGIPLNAITHRLLVNCILPVKLQHGFESMAVCINNTDYYSRGRMSLNPENIGNVAKVAGIDPKIVSKNLFIQTAYDSQHQEQVAKQVSQLVTSNENIKLVVINNITKCFKDSSGQKRPEIASSIKNVISTISRACVRNKVTIIATGDANSSSKGIIPRPIGGSYLKHVANVIVYIKDISENNFLPRFKATLTKHQYLRTSRSVIVHCRKARRMILLN